MKRPQWSIATGPGDFLPLVVGLLMVMISLPTAVLLMFNADTNSGVIGMPIMVLMIIGTMIGIGFMVLGVQLLSEPGSLAFQLAHGRIPEALIRRKRRYTASG